MTDILIQPVRSGIELPAGSESAFADILTPEALDFVAALEREFRAERKTLLGQRAERQHRIDAGEMPEFLASTRRIRDDHSWGIGSVPHDLQDRRVEITGPVERKMMINALNSGAQVFMADFEDAHSPTWHNILQGHRNLRDAIDRTITYTSPEGKFYKLNEDVATLVVRPRGWHLEEKHVIVDGEPISAALFDFGMSVVHQTHHLLARGTGPYFYLPKLESHLEARLWNSVFEFAQERLGLPRGTIKATVLIETILAAFEMEEILYELKDHIVGLNAGRWDYIFSIIKKFRGMQEFVFPDRSQITMTVPFMRAYTELLVRTCHKRGAHAIGGMAAFIPSRKDPKVNEVALAKVTEDKVRESNDGFDGTWVAHPDLVPVARKPFDVKLGHAPHQKHRLREEVRVSAADLLDFRIPHGSISETGLRNNISVALQYVAAWLGGQGAVGIFNLMEDAATAEIARSQVWQWLHHHGATLNDGRAITPELYRHILPDELNNVRQLVGEEVFASERFKLAMRLFNHLVMQQQFTEFLTIDAYKYLH